MKTVSLMLVALAAGAWALAGRYVGAKASAAAGLGTGAQFLIGGGEKSFTLQPLALEGGTGLGTAGGVGYLFLESTR